MVAGLLLFVFVLLGDTPKLCYAAIFAAPGGSPQRPATCIALRNFR